MNWDTELAVKGESQSMMKIKMSEDNGTNVTTEVGKWSNRGSGQEVVEEMQDCKRNSWRILSC